MNSRILAVLLATGCVTAAAGGRILAVRQNGDVAPPAVTNAAPPAPTARPVNETEAVIDRAPPAAAKPETASAPERNVASPAPAPSAGRTAPAPVPAPRHPPPHRPKCPNRNRAARPIRRVVLCRRSAPIRRRPRHTRPHR